MTKPVILLRNYNRLPIPALLTLARAVAAGSIFLNATLFPTPPVSKSVLTGLIDDLQSKYDDARNRDIVAVAQQDLADKLLLQALGSLARYAAPIVYNDRLAIEASGFEASDDHTVPPGLPVLAPFEPEALKGGGLRLNFGPKGKDATSFTVIVAGAAAGGMAINLSAAGDLTITNPGNAPLIIRTDTHSKITIADVLRSTDYVVYAFATGPAGNSTLSAGMPVRTL